MDSSNPFSPMKKTRRQKAPAGAGEVFALKPSQDSGPWDGAVPPERANTCVRCFMRWYRQRLGLSLHRVQALTGIDRAYLRRLERRRIHLSLMVLWRWANGLQVNVDWVVKMARRHELERAAARAASPAAGGGSLAAPCSKPALGAESPHASHDRHLQSSASAQPAAPNAALGGAGGGGSENSFPAGGEGASGSENSFPEDLLFAYLPEKSFPAPHPSGAGLENLFPRGLHLLWGSENSFLAPVLFALAA